jgi:hypothetical protein
MNEDIRDQTPVYFVAVPRIWLPLIVFITGDRNITGKCRVGAVGVAYRKPH